MADTCCTSGHVHEKDDVQLKDLSTDDDSAPELENAPTELTKEQAEVAKAAGLTDDATSKSKQTKGEKKARKAILKLGMKGVPGISRVTIRKSKSILFVINQPEVFKSPGSDTYIVFGEAKIEDMSQQLHNAAANKMKERSAAEASEGAKTVNTAADQEAENVAEADLSDDNEELDSAGLEDKDIELTMTQANVSRNKAIKALREHNNDMVEAIMALTG